MKPGPAPRADLVGRAGARIERELVGRDVEDARVVVEHPLRAVAVVDVDVDDRDAREPARERVRRGDRDVVEEAEAHRAVALGVVARRPDQRERRLAARRAHAQPPATAAPAASSAISYDSGEVKVSASSITARPAVAAIASR